MTELRGQHSSKPGCAMGVDSDTGKVSDMKSLGIWEPANVKLQTLKTSVECAVLLLRIDDIVSGMKRRGAEAAAPKPRGMATEGDGGNVDSEQALPE
jgi:T-complex protein 1 subunit gamma